MAGLFELTAAAAPLPEALPPNVWACFPVWDDNFGYIRWLDRGRKMLYVAHTSTHDGESFDRAAVVPLLLANDAEVPDFLAHTKLDYNSRQGEDAGPTYYVGLAARSLEDRHPDAPLPFPAPLCEEGGHPSRHVLILGAGAGPSLPASSTDNLYALIMPQGVPWVADGAAAQAPTDEAAAATAEPSSPTKTVFGANYRRLEVIRQPFLGPLSSADPRRQRKIVERWLFNWGSRSFVTKDFFAQLRRHSATPSTMAWSPDGGVLYLVARDRPTAIAAFSVKAPRGTSTACPLSLATTLDGAHRQTFWTIPQHWQQQQLPLSDLSAISSLCVDGAGHVWAAISALGCVVRLSRQQGDAASGTATATPTGTVRLPVKGLLVTGCCFGGPNLGILYITAVSPREGVDQGTATDEATKASRSRLFTVNVASFARGLPTPRIHPGDLATVPDEAAGLLERYMTPPPSAGVSKL